MAFKVQIVDINENFDNIILVSGLTIERLKIKYNWVLNASVKNCIIGEDDYGLVWYSGEWVCGEWKDGTWYSGIWHDGQWDNGKWYSYLVDKAMVISNRFVILDKGNIYSEFRSGLWLQGDFYGGIFGDDRELPKTASSSDLIGRTFISSYWFNGKFHDGIFKSSVWYNGVFYDGDMTGSYWMNGKFYNGNFYYHNPGGTINWYNGNWYGGNFVEGNWGNGSFDQIDPTIPSRFGTASSATTLTEWHGGTFYSGDFMSGWNFDGSGNTLPSIDDSLTQWKGGDFRGGKWWGGHFNFGNFWIGNWYGGVFGNQTGVTYSNNTIWYDGNWYNGLWMNGIFYDGHFYDGMWLDGQFINGYMSTSVIENPLLVQSLVTNVSLPIVTATTATSIGANSAIANGRVLNNGGATILDRGICYSASNPLPTIGDITSLFVSDGGSMGSINIQLNGLGYNTLYYYRVFASNITGSTYSNVVTFTTLPVTNAVPNVQTFPPLQTLYNSFPGNGKLLSDPTNPVTNYGFVWTTGSTSPSPSYLVSGLYIDPNNQGEVSQVGPIIGAPCDFPVQLTISPLNANTPYWYRAYAQNVDGIGYGDIIPVVTPLNNPPTIPTVVTNLVDTIADTSAVTHGQVTNNGNSTLLAVGVCWSTSPNPTTLDSTATVTPTTVPYAALMTGLIPETTYYVRAYATNGVGTGYGAQLTFVTTKLRTVPTVLLVQCTPL